MRCQRPVKRCLISGPGELSSVRSWVEHSSTGRLNPAAHSARLVNPTFLAELNITSAGTEPAPRGHLMSNLGTLGRGILSGFTQLIYPNTCWTCGVVMPPEQRAVCAICMPRLTVDPFPTCPRCSSTVGPHLTLEHGCPACTDESFAFYQVFRMAPYEGLLREVILRMKLWTGEDLAEAIAGLWAKHMANRLAAFQADVVIPVPLFWTRRWRRGFNLADILAAALARELAVPCWPRALRRVRATPPQTGQTSASGRRENVKHAFQAAGRSTSLARASYSSMTFSPPAPRPVRPPDRYGRSNRRRSESPCLPTAGSPWDTLVSAAVW